MAFYEPYYVKNICDGFIHDESNKDVVFLVGDEQLSYHSQVLRSMFPLIRNLLPNPGACPCHVFVPNFYHITITLDKVSVWTVSTLMSSIYNPSKPVYLSPEEMTSIKELLLMLGSDNNKCNFTLIQPSIVLEQTEVDIILDRATESDNKTKVNKEELLKDAEVVKNIEHSETIGEICIDESKQADGSFSSTVPQEEELDESVDDEEITFSIDASMEEIVEIDDGIDNQAFKGNLDNIAIYHSKLKKDIICKNISGLSASKAEDKPEDCTKDVNTSANNVAASDGVDRLPDDDVLKGNTADSATLATEKYSESSEMGSDLRLEEEPLTEGNNIVNQQCTIDADDGNEFQNRYGEIVEKDVARNVVADETMNIGAVGMGTVGSPEMAENPETGTSKTCIGDTESVTGDKIENETNLEMEDSGEESFKSDKDLVCVRKSRNLSTEDDRNRVDVEDMTVDQHETHGREISNEGPVLQDHIGTKESQLHELQTLDYYEDDIEATEDDIDEEFGFVDSGYLGGHTAGNKEIGMASSEVSTKTLEGDAFVLNKDEENSTIETNILGKKRKCSTSNVDCEESSKREKLDKCPSPVQLSVATEAPGDEESDSEESVDLDVSSLSAPPEDVRRVKRDLSLSFEMEEDEDENVVDMELFASKGRVLIVKVDNGKTLITDILETLEMRNIEDILENAKIKVDDSKGSHSTSDNHDNKSETLNDLTTISTKVQLYSERNQSGQVEIGEEESSRAGADTDLGNKTIVEQTGTVSVKVSVEINGNDDDNDANLITAGQVEEYNSDLISSKNHSNTMYWLKSKDEKDVLEEAASNIVTGEYAQELKDPRNDDSNICIANEKPDNAKSGDDNSGIKEGELIPGEGTEEKARLEKQVSGPNRAEDLVNFETGVLKDLDGSKNVEDSEGDSLSDASTIISDITAEDDTNDSCFQEDTRELGDEMSTENLGEKYESVEEIVSGAPVSQQLDVVRENLGDSSLRTYDGALLDNCSNSKSKDHVDDTTLIAQGNVGVSITEQVEKVSELVMQPLSKLEHVGNTCDEDESDLLTMDEDDIDMLNEQIEKSIVQENIRPGSVTKSSANKQNTEFEEEGASLDQSMDPAVRAEISNANEEAESSLSPALSANHDDGEYKDQGLDRNEEFFPLSDSTYNRESLGELKESDHKENENVRSTLQTDSYLDNGVSSPEELRDEVIKDNVVEIPRTDSSERLENTVTGCWEAADRGPSNEIGVGIVNSVTDSLENLKNGFKSHQKPSQLTGNDDVSASPLTDLSVSVPNEVASLGENTDEDLEEDNERRLENADQSHEFEFEVSHTVETLDDNSTNKVRPVEVKQAPKKVSFAVTATSLEDEQQETYQSKIAETASNDKVVSDLYCTVCPDQPIFRRGQLLVHLTDKHYSKKLLQLYPFTEGSCQLCVEANRPRATVCKTKAAYAKHVGTVHEKVLELVPKHLKDAVLAIGKRRLSVSAKEVDSEDMKTVGSSTQESKGNVPESESITEEKEAVETPAPGADNDVKNEDQDTENPLPVISEGTRAEAKAISSGKCPFCPNSKTQFPRASMLNHLSSTHYNKQLLDAFPYKEGETCKLCLETGRQNPLVVKSKTRYITHMGSLHEKVIDLLPSEIRDALEVTKKVPVRTSRRSSIANKELLDTSSPPPALPAQLQQRSGPPGPPSSTRAPAPGPPMMTAPGSTSRTYPRTRTVSTLDEEDIPSNGKGTRGKTKETEKNVYLHKFSGVSISKID